MGNGTYLSDCTMNFQIFENYRVIPCNLDEAQWNQLIQGLTLSNVNEPAIRSTVLM